MRRYNSFLVRHWSLAAGRERIEVRHFQSERHAHLASLDEAAEWMAEVATDDKSEPLTTDIGGDAPAEPGG